MLTTNERAEPASKTKIRTVCAWGGGVMVEGPLDDQGRSSHGICPCCKRRQLGQGPAADAALLLRAMVLGVARWESFNRNTTPGTSGEVCVGGLRHGTELDAAGVPILTALLRRELPAAIAKAEGRR